MGPNGAGFDDGKLFVTNGMQTVVALDATSGERIWSKRIVSDVTQGITQQLTAHDGILYVSTIPGSSASHFYEGGGMGIIHALDERSGDELWSFNTVKNGQLWGNPKVNSGGGAWYPPAVDTSNGTTYWGIGNPAPFPGTKAFPSGSSRPGPNLYTDSELALDSSGDLQWFRQVKPHDLTDGDFQVSPILTTATIGGLTVLCRDEVPFVDRSTLADSLRGDAAYQAVFGSNPDLDACLAWDVPAAEAVMGEPVTGDVPVLILTGQFDPHSPTPVAEEAASKLARAYVVEIPGQGHNVLGTGDCAVSIRNAWVAHPESPPDATGCLASLSVSFATAST